MNKNKRIPWIIIVILTMAVLAAAYYISKQNYARNLPRVVTTHPVSLKMSFFRTVVARQAYEDKVAAYAPTETRVKRLCAKTGTVLHAGERILRLDTDELKRKKLELEWEIESTQKEAEKINWRIIHMVRIGL